MQGEIELGFTRVTLATGSTPQLVVDATGLMALGREHIQAAEGHDLIMLGLHRTPRLVNCRGPCGFVGLRVERR